MNSLSEKIAEISIDAKQAEQIGIIFDLGFEAGYAFKATTLVDRHDQGYHDYRKAYLAVAGPMFCQMFDELIKDYEKSQNPKKL